jgi:predicted nucleotidyltransferase
MNPPGTPRKRYPNLLPPGQTITQEVIMSVILPDLVRRIVEIVDPLRIILFGSAARGEFGPDSDLDVLVVVPDGTHCLHSCQDIYMGMRNLGVSKDVLVVTEGNLATHRDEQWTVFFHASRQGMELYRKHGYREPPRPRQGPRKKPNRLPRRWVLIGRDGKSFLHLKVTRPRIQAIERIAKAHGWGFTEAARKVLLAGLASLEWQGESQKRAASDGVTTPAEGV